MYAVQGRVKSTRVDDHADGGVRYAYLVVEGNDGQDHVMENVWVANKIDAYIEVGNDVQCVIYEMETKKKKKTYLRQRTVLFYDDGKHEVDVFDEVVGLAQKTKRLLMAGAVSGFILCMISAVFLIGLLALPLPFAALSTARKIRPPQRPQYERLRRQLQPRAA